MKQVLSVKYVRYGGLFLAGFFAWQVLVGFDSRDVTPEQRITKRLNEQLTEFAVFVKDTLQPLAERRADLPALQNAFLKARIYYKRVEWATEYFTYATARSVNGVPKEEAEIAGQTITQPHGFQLMETYLFPSYGEEQRTHLLAEIAEMNRNIVFFQQYFTGMELAAWQVLDAAKLEIFRIETLGITGFDDPLTLKCLPESATALGAVQDVLAQYVPTNDSLISAFRQAKAYLHGQHDFNGFDRAHFIRVYANSLSTGIEQFVRRKKLFTYRYNRLLRQEAFTLFDSAAFDPAAYSPFLQQAHVPEKIALGKKLFSDPVFSGNGTRSCASCHLPDQAYANHAVREKSVDGKGLIDRNTPTLINTALQPQQFYDQRAQNIEDQVVDVVHNPKEMNGSLDKAVSLIAQSADYRKLYGAAFPDAVSLTKDALVEALSAFVRSLVRLNSRFDQYMRGDDGALNADEIAGFNLFMGKAQCATCHYMPLFSGVLPPKYITQDAEVLGVPAVVNGKEIDPDKGLFSALLSQGLYGSEQVQPFLHAFKTVSVRNTSNTAPYMHNGVFATLEEVMDFYNKGGGAGMGLHVPNQSLSDAPLQLTPQEIQQVIAFIKALESR